MIKVYHGKNFGQMALKQTQWPADYELVATVKTDDLEKAFELTNHINSIWMQNPDVTAEPGQHRSTSVGDVMVDESARTWQCGDFGWREIASVQGDA